VLVAHLGVTRCGESGDLENVYRYHHINTDSIMGAALDLID
jgi:pyruvate dehydrogenase E1 component